MSYHKLIVLLLLVWSVEGQGTDDPLTSPKGMIYRVYLMMDKKIKEEYNISSRDIRQIFEGANRITSSQLNIHLQVFDKRSANLPYHWSATVLLNSTQMIALEKYSQGVHFDHFILLHSNVFNTVRFSPYEARFQENSACNNGSIALLNVLDEAPKDKVAKVLPVDNLSRLVAKDIMWSVFVTKFPDLDPNTCGDEEVCLSEYGVDIFGWRQGNSSMASSSYKQFVKSLLTGKKTLDDLNVPLYLRQGGEKHNFNCLKNNVPPAKQGNRSLSLCGNGIKEKREECDCFAFDQECKTNYCDVISCKLLPGATTAPTTEAASTHPTTSRTDKPTINARTEETTRVKPDDNDLVTYQRAIMILVIVLLIFFTISVFAVICAKRSKKYRSESSTDPSIDQNMRDTDLINSF